MDMQNIGGITMKEIITFQTQIMMGAQFGRVKNATNADDIIIACLRMGWNDAFRHASENTKEIKGNKSVSILDIKETEWRKEHKTDYDDFICGKILNQGIVISTFLDYAKAKNSKEKTEIINSNWDELKKLFKPYKATEGKKQLCFGHFQKMFNIAIKLYLCLYMCREFIEIDDDRFDTEIINNIPNADCPVDSIILKDLSHKTNDSSFAQHKWSKYGTKNHPVDRYTTVQNAISELKDVKDKSKLYYDFIAWKQQ